MIDAFIGTIIPWPCDFAPKGWLLCYGQIMNVSDNTALFSLLGDKYGGNGRTTFGIPDLRGRAVIGNGVGPGITPKFLGQMSGSEYVNTAPMLASHTHAIPTTGMTTDLSTANINVVASEITINSTGSYGVPITSESNDATGMPTDSEHYLGTPKLNNGAALNTYYKSNSNPTVTTKATAINVIGKVTPTINASLSGNASVSVQNGLTVSNTGNPNPHIPVVQPSLTMNYIICTVGIYPQRS